jgi:phytoene dehydrogenase-like protein
MRRAVPQMFTWDEAPVMMGMMLLAYMHAGNAGFPAGGSFKFAQALEKRFLDLGGEISYRSQVEKILVKDGKAVGVRLYNDEVHTADYVISAADGRSTIFDMLGGEFADRKIRRMYDGHLPTHQMVQVSLGVKRDLSKEPHWVTHLLDEPLLIAGQERSEIGVKHYCFDPSLAPAGKSVIEFMVRTNYAYWQHIYGRSLYDKRADPGLGHPARPGRALVPGPAGRGGVSRRSHAAQLRALHRQLDGRHLRLAAG